MLQPRPEQAEKAFIDFLQSYYPPRGLFDTNPVSKKLKKQRMVITQNWIAFMQAWEFAGEKGVLEFLDFIEDGSSLEVDDAFELLLASSDLATIEWIESKTFGINELRGFGQVYYQYGQQGLQLLINKFRQMEIALGEEFFDTFHENYLKSFDNYTSLMNEKTLIAMDRMMEDLSGLKEGQRQAFQVLLHRHIDTVGYDELATVWNAFEYFSKELAQMGLELDGSEFDELEIDNMLVFLDRVLSSLKAIPSLDMQKVFLAQLDDMDLQQGGVHYAIQYEKFKFFDPELGLTEFKMGDPTYAPSIEAIFDWDSDKASTYMLRVLASQPIFSYREFAVLKEALSELDKYKLILLIHTKYPHTDMEKTLASLDLMSERFLGTLAQHIHHAVYKEQNKHIDVSLDTLLKLQERAEGLEVELPSLLMEKYTDGTALECFTFLDRAGKFDKHFSGFLSVLQDAQKPTHDYPNALYNSGLKLASLFYPVSKSALTTYLEQTQDLEPIVSNQLKLLFTQMFSVDFDASTFDFTQSGQTVFDAFNATIAQMNKDPRNTEKYRLDFISQLDKFGIKLQYSKSGDYRALKDIQEEKPDSLDFFIDHKDRIWRFLREHIAISEAKGPQESLAPIMRLFKQLQLNRTYLNELEPLLATLEETPRGKYWSAEFFQGLLKALEPMDSQSAFPISILKVILDDEYLQATDIDLLRTEFPEGLVEPFQAILSNSAFSRSQQTKLCKIALKEFNWNDSAAQTLQIMQTLSTDAYVSISDVALDILLQATHEEDLTAKFKDCQWFVSHPGKSAKTQNWTKTTQIWLEALSKDSLPQTLLTHLKSLPLNDKKQSLILHILAYSTLEEGLRDSESYDYEFKYLSERLLNELAGLTESDLELLADSYPNQPCPGTDDLRRIIKKHAQEGTSIESLIELYQRSPFSEPRPDYGELSSTRQSDLRRMIANCKISAKDPKASIKPGDAVRLTLIFKELKALESGKALISGFEIPVREMSQEQLQDAFRTLSQTSKREPDNDSVRTQIWAVMFECLGRTTKKYPHLAQQFAIIANDVCITSANSSVLQLATGEGKSHFVAMRAARHAGQGKVVDICTAKRTLAMRDQEDYQDFFDYLGITTSYIHPKSSRETFDRATIHFTTIGDLSLFQDEQSYSGHPIEIDPNDRVALFDEFDYTRFEEGRKTEYNYARPSGKTPKQLTWFYQAVNDFYQANKEDLMSDHEISGEDIVALIKHLKKMAGDIEERQAMVERLAKDPVQVVQWIRSAHQAYSLQRGVSFTVRKEDIEVGDETYPMQEIIPLSTDNQVMSGSTFSAGVHQLLAIRLNTDARKRGEPQNFHVHPESRIASSQVAAQRMATLWGRWEGFSGTISSSQAANLQTDYGTEVLHVPTNQRDLRSWHEPGFYEDEEERMEQVVENIRNCIRDKKSMLFSCRNDKHVNELRKLLSERLTPEELQHFDFYTNEEDRSPQEVLQSKTKKEDWKGGKKQFPIALVASGFGRGDNVGVEAVFLFDVNDNNDKLQKGGRTARNGAKGEVFQFYIDKDILAEQTRLLASLVRRYNMVEATLRDQLNPTKGDTDSKAIFENVMLLREYSFSLRNAANENYRFSISEYSGWAMDWLGKIQDPTLRHEMTEILCNQIKSLDKSWVVLSGDETRTLDEQVQEARKAIENQAKYFIERYKDTQGDIEMTFALSPHKPIDIKMGQTDVPRKRSRKDIAMQSIAISMMRVTGLTLEAANQAKLDKHIQEIAELDGEGLHLYYFSQQLSRVKTLEDLDKAARIALRNGRKPSEKYQALVEAAADDLYHPQDLYHGVKPDQTTQFDFAMREMIPELRESVIDMMQTMGDVRQLPAERMRLSLPLVQYLSRFSVDEQDASGQTYVDESREIFNHSNQAAINVLLSTLDPMDFREFETVLNLVDKLGHTEDEIETIGLSLQKALKGSDPEQRTRMLSRWEIWSNGLSDKDKLTFLPDFCKTLEQFEAGENWDIFVRLMAKTHRWWNRGIDLEFQTELMDLWRHLADQGEDIKGLERNYLMPMLALGGETWFALLNKSFSVLNPYQIATHGPLLVRLAQDIQTLKVEREEEETVYNDLLESIKCFEELSDKLSAEVKAELIETLHGYELDRAKEVLEFVKYHRVLFNHNANNLTRFIQLGAKRQERFIELVDTYEKSFNANPELFTEILWYFNQPEIYTDTRLAQIQTFWKAHRDLLVKSPALLSEFASYVCDEEIEVDSINQIESLLVKATQYQLAHPKQMSLGTLFSAIRSYKKESGEFLSQVDELFDPKVSASPLFDLAARHLDENVPLSGIEANQSLIKDFYAAYAKRKPGEDILSILEDTKLNSLFKFSAREADSTHQRRVILMHLLNHGILISEGVPLEAQESLNPALFSKEENQ